MLHALSPEGTIFNRFFLTTYQPASIRFPLGARHRAQRVTRLPGSPSQPHREVCTSVFPFSGRGSQGPRSLCQEVAEPELKPVSMSVPNHCALVALLKRFSLTVADCSACSEIVSFLPLRRLFYGQISYPRLLPCPLTSFHRWTGDGTKAQRPEL